VLWQDFGSKAELKAIEATTLGQVGEELPEPFKSQGDSSEGWTFVAPVEEARGVIRGFDRNEVVIVDVPSTVDSYHGEWHVRFSHNEDIFVLMTAAIGRVDRDACWIWPTAAPTVAATERFLAKVSWHYDSINPQQQQAIARFCSRPNGSENWPPYLVHGPPGTGKTITTVETVLQLLLDKSNTVLLVAPSNAAADVLCSRLVNKGVPSTLMHRFFWRKRRIEAVPSHLLPYSHQDAESGRLAYLPLAELQRKQVIVCTCLAAGILHDLGVRKGQFSHILIDEAGHALEPETLVPLSLAAKATQMMLVGDPMQLGAVVRSKVARRHGLGMSMLERLLQLPFYHVEPAAGPDAGCVSVLLSNYRSHSKILDISSAMFYQSKLRACADPRVVDSLCSWKELGQQEQFPIVCYGIEGVEAYDDDGTGKVASLYNLAEATKVADVVQSLMEAAAYKVTAEQFGIIAPYRKHVATIRTILRRRGFGSVRVGCINDYQGQEARIIIISTVLSTLHQQSKIKSDLTATFLDDPKRFNVAISRAAALVVIVGNPHVLLSAPCWQDVVRNCVLNDCYKGCAIPRLREEEGGDHTALADLLAVKSFLTDYNQWEPNMANLEAVYRDEQDWRVDI
jgi:DNA polymerase III delta prime subunit